MVTCFSKFKWIGLNYIVKPPICFKLEKHVTIFLGHPVLGGGDYNTFSLWSTLKGWHRNTIKLIKKRLRAGCIKYKDKYHIFGGHNWDYDYFSSVDSFVLGRRNYKKWEAYNSKSY